MKELSRHGIYPRRLHGHRHEKELPAWFSEEFVAFSEVYVSAGQRGLQLAVNPNEFLRVARGSLADITADVREETRSDV